MRTVLGQREAAGKILITSTRRPPAGRLVLASALLLGLAGWLLGDVSAATPRPVAGTPAPRTFAVAPAPQPSAAAPADHVNRKRHHACRAAAPPRCAGASHRHPARRHADRRHADRRHADGRPADWRVQTRRR